MYQSSQVKLKTKTKQPEVTKKAKNVLDLTKTETPLHKQFKLENSKIKNYQQHFLKPGY